MAGNTVANLPLHHRPSSTIEIMRSPSATRVVDTLRPRRRQQPPTTTTRPTPSPDIPAPHRPVGFILSSVTILVQFLLIIYLATRSQSPHAPKSTPPPFPGFPPAQFTHTDVHITIYSYDRPRHLLNLLSDIQREAKASNLTVSVNVIDDNSYACTSPSLETNLFDLPGPPDPNQSLIRVPLDDPSGILCAARHRFHHVEHFLRSRGWNMYVSKYRHARRRYWHLVALAHALLHQVSADYFLFLPDDDRLASGFFDHVIPLWHSIQDDRKMTMMLHVEETREHNPVWTSLKPRPENDHLMRIGWVESGNFLCQRPFLQFMNWTFPQVPPQRWEDNANISSGVGSTMSEMLFRQSKRMYRTKRSYVAHVGVSLSKMNAEFRKRGCRALVTKYFSDGEDAYKRLLEEAATVTASMASQWSREMALHAAVESLAPHVDRLNVYLNSYSSVPSFLNAPFVTVITGQDEAARGDIGDIGKFFWCNDIDTEFHLTVDDDIIYPTNYVTELIKFWRRFEPPVVVGAHGIRIKQSYLTPPGNRRSKGYYASRDVWMGVGTVSEPVNVHIIGTGTMLYRPSDVGYVDIDTVFPHPNMADIWFGLLAQERKLPMMIIPHKGGWISEVPGTTTSSIYKQATRTRRSDQVQTEAAMSIEKWELNEATNAN